MYQLHGFCMYRTLLSKRVVHHCFVAVYPGIRSHSQMIPSLSPLVNPFPSLIWNTWLRLVSTSSNGMNDRIKPVKKNERNKNKKKMRSLDKAMDLFLGGSLKRLPTSPVETERTKKSPKSSQTANSSSKIFHVFCSCLPGLEPYLHHELVSLGITPTSSSPSGSKRPRHLRGGVEFTTDSLESLLTCHLNLGTASHVFLRANPIPFRALGMEELYRKVSHLPFWKEYVSTMEGENEGETMVPPLDIRVTTSKSRLFHTVAIAERVERGIRDALCSAGAGPSETKNPTPAFSQKDETQSKDETNALKILVRIHRDKVQISVDTSATPLHRRGYRLEGSKAPLREDLAYALLYAAGWPPPSSRHNRHATDEVRLMDPFCGSGTIVIEGAAMLHGLPPGRLRPPPLPFSKYIVDNPEAWDVAVGRSMDRAQNAKEKGRVMVLGSDRDQGAVEAAVRNAERAGVCDFIGLEHGSIGEMLWARAKGDYVLVATNPPFGRRVSRVKVDNKENENGLLSLYQTLGWKLENITLYNDEDRANEKFKVGFEQQGETHLAILAHNPKLARRTGVKDLNAIFTTKHGGLTVCALSTTEKINKVK